MIGNKNKYAKGGMTGFNKFFDKFKRSDAYISEPRKTAKGNYIVEVDPYDKETSKKMKDYMQSEGIGYSPKPMGKGFYTQFAKGGITVGFYDEGQKSMRFQQFDNREETKKFLEKEGMKEVKKDPKTRKEFKFYAKGGLTQFDNPPYYVVKLINWDRNIKRVSGRFRTEDEAKKKAEQLKEKYKGRSGYFVEITFYDEQYNAKELDFAKGGEVNKKENNEMLIGGLAGILLGIFLNK